MSLLSANLQAFQAISQNGTVHGAAVELNLTQTGVTQRIRALEKELGTTLFLRSRKGMTPTQEGKALLRYCQGATDLEGQVINQITGSAHDSPIDVTIVGPTSIMTARVVDQCVSLYSKWPQLYLHFIISDVKNRLSMVRNGKASFAIVPPDQVPNEMDSKFLKKDKYVLVASPKWKGRKLTSIIEHEKIIDFDEDDTTTRNYLKQFKLDQEIRKPRLFVNNNEAIIKLFSRGVGYGTLTQEVANPFLKSNKLIILNKGAAMEEPLALVWYPRPEMPQYYKDIIQQIK